MRKGLFEGEEYIIGKVYFDYDGSKTQSPGENGVPGVSLFTEDGIKVTTDQNGKFSIPDISPGTHVLRLDPLSLPEGAIPQVTTTMNALDPWSQFVMVPVSGFARASFALSVGSSVVEKRFYENPEIRVELNFEPSQMSFEPDFTLMGEQLRAQVFFGSGEFELTENDMSGLESFLDSLKFWEGAVIELKGYADNTPVKPNPYYKDNYDLSQKRAESVKKYLLERGMKRVDVKVIGFGDKESRSASFDRRVDIVTSREGGARAVNASKPVNVSTRVFVDCNDPISELTLKYSFSGLEYVEGTASYSGRPMDDYISNTGDVGWTIKDLPGKLSGMFHFLAQMPEGLVLSQIPGITLSGEILFASGATKEFNAMRLVQPSYSSGHVSLSMPENMFNNIYISALDGKHAKAISEGQTLVKEQSVLVTLRIAGSKNQQGAMVEVIDRIPKGMAYMSHSASIKGKEIACNIVPGGVSFIVRLPDDGSMLEIRYLTMAQQNLVVPRLSDNARIRPVQKER
jgi:outer membrane protein OmpA-like peptidoglycan-associated protein